ncbi:hypothetical protein HZS_931 [Henneguya salminicola]|uniref:Small ubiquitin-related modifier 1 (Trinotate prediction) n=1 Tax=Henneguya salminicola TaxID=69463 RepID=A0A6G3MM99_HENSL|nr:hypothetical protein HZS_931 [Henneguya salminicola]
MSEENDQEDSLKKVKEEENYVTVKVLDTNGSHTMFKINRTAQLAKLTKAYCERKGIKSSSVRFFVNGQRITDAATAKELNIENGDVIEVFTGQQGGSIIQAYAV